MKYEKNKISASDGGELDISDVRDPINPKDAVNMRYLMNRMLMKESNLLDLADAAAALLNMGGASIEFGTYTPTVSTLTTPCTISYNTQKGAYIIIGNKFVIDIFEMRFACSNRGSGDVLKHLPVASKSNSILSACTLGIFNALQDFVDYALGYVDGNQSALRIGNGVKLRLTSGTGNYLTGFTIYEKA